MTIDTPQATPYPERILDDYDRIYASLGDVEGLLDLTGRLFGDRRCRVLDVGCGTGRISLGFARAGHQVTAVDVSEPMLDRLEERAAGLEVTTSRQDFRVLDLPGRFDLVVLSMNTFFMAHSHDDKIAVLDGIRRHLSPGGRVILDCTDPHWFLQQASPHTYAMPIAPDAFVTVTNFVDRARQRLTVSYQVTDGDGVRTFPEHSTWVTPGETELLARLAGLRLVSRHGDYGQGDHGHESRQVISVLARQDDPESREEPAP